MLCLSRTRGQQIRIGDDIVVTVLEVRADGVVRIGIDAPKDVAIFRQEIAPPRPRDDGGKDGAA